MFLFILFVNSPYFIRYSKTYRINNITVTRVGHMTHDVYLATELIKIFMEVYVPYVIMIILDILVIVRLRRPTLENAVRLILNNRFPRFTIHMILIDLIYLIFKFPSTVFSEFYLIALFETNVIRYVYFIDQLLAFDSFAYTSFLLFLFLIFNRIFRIEFISMASKATKMVKNCFTKV